MLFNKSFKLEMNGALRFFAIAFLLALCYHWLGDDDWTDMEEDTDETQEDLINKFSQSFHRKSGDQVVKGENGKFKADLEELHSSKLPTMLVNFCDFTNACYYFLQDKS